MVPGHGRRRRRPRRRLAAHPRHVAPAAGAEVNFRPDPTIFDGRFANNGWLQELPKPVTKLTWDNAIIVSPKTAKQKGLMPRPEYTGGGEHGRVVAGGRADRRRAEGDRAGVGPAGARRRLGDGPPGLRPGGGPRREGGHQARGFDAYKVRGSDAPWGRPAP